MISPPTMPTLSVAATFAAAADVTGTPRRSVICSGMSIVTPPALI
jgi:hypothetical protein